MKFIVFLLFIIITLGQSVFAQNEALSPVERAYLFHIVKKSPILEMHIGRYFEYSGEMIKFSNGQINYDSLESVIINDPNTLIIRHDELRKSAKGILAEAANKTAIWELNKMLLAKRTKDPIFNTYENRYERFEKLLIYHLPSSVLTDDGKSLHPRMDHVLNPSMSLDDKIAQLTSFRNVSVDDQVVILNGIALAINEYIEQRTKEIFAYLGGEYTNFRNILTAAGDGSTTSGLLDEREKDEKGRWNKGLPKAIGLFPYDVYLTKPTNKKEKPKIEPMRYTVTDLTTVGSNFETTLHFDVWGYNANKQTTVVIEKNGKSYHLFGAADTRFLSPDSTFSAGKTYQSMINDLEFVKIAKLTDMISGKRGFDYWIEYYTQKKRETELKIEKAEKHRIDLGYTPVTTKSKPSAAVKKSKKLAVKGGVGADNWKGAPTTDANKKEQAKAQTSIVNLYNLFESYKMKIKELQKEKQEAIDLRASYQQRLDEMKRLMGYNWMNYTVSDGLYIFSDSARFDMYSQEFTFPASEKEEAFEVRLVAIPESALSKSADEVMLHMSMIDARPNYNARVQVALKDQFESDQFDVKFQIFKDSDSLAIRQFFEALLDKEKNLKLFVRGNGIGKWNGAKVVKDFDAKERNSYGSAGKGSEEFVRLRTTEVMINIEREIILEVDAYSDMVKSNFKAPNVNLEALKKVNGWSANDLLTAYRAVAVIKKMKEELNLLAGTYMTREEAKIIIDRFNRNFEKIKVLVNKNSIKISEFL